MIPQCGSGVLLAVDAAPLELRDHQPHELLEGARSARRAMPCRSRWKEEGGNAAGGTTAYFPLSPSSPHTGGRRAILHGQGSSTHKKARPGTVGVSPYKLPPLSLERTSQRSVKQVSWLAAFPYSLHLPEAWCLSGSCRFRSAYSCGAAMASHHLPCSHTARVSSPTSVLCNSLCELTAVLPVLSRTFLQRAPWQARGAVGRPSPQSAGVIFRSSLH